MSELIHSAEALTQLPSAILQIEGVSQSPLTHQLSHKPQNTFEKMMALALSVMIAQLTASTANTSTVPARRSDLDKLCSDLPASVLLEARTAVLQPLKQTLTDTQMTRNWMESLTTSQRLQLEVGLPRRAPISNCGRV